MQLEELKVGNQEKGSDKSRTEKVVQVECLRVFLEKDHTLLQVDCQALLSQNKSPQSLLDPLNQVQFKLQQVDVLITHH